MVVGSRLEVSWIPIYYFYWSSFLLFNYLGFFKSENELYNNFMKTADQKRTDFSFSHTTTDAELIKQYGEE